MFSPCVCAQAIWSHEPCTTCSAWTPSGPAWVLCGRPGSSSPSPGPLMPFTPSTTSYAVPRWSPWRIPTWTLRGWRWAMSGRSVSWEQSWSRLKGLLLLGFQGRFLGCYLGGISYSCSQAKLGCQPCQVCEALEWELESELVFRAVFPSEAQGCCCQQGLSGDLAKSTCGCLKQERPSQRKCYLLNGAN